MVKRILVAFDGSDKSYEAFDFALDMAEAGKPAAQIFVVSVVQPPESIYLVQTDDIITGAIAQYKELQKALEEKAKARNLYVKTDVLVGHPADQIVKRAKETLCDMVVVGHKGKSMIEGWLLGSVSRRVASYAHCTVTIVK